MRDDLVRDYGFADYFDEDDPGNLLRKKLSTISVGREGFYRLDELLYTANERGILENSMSREDVETIFRLMVIATTLKNNEELDQYKM